MIKQALFTFIISFSLFCLSVNAQSVRYSVDNFGVKDYGKNMDVQNWAVLQSLDGLMYFGNANGVLEYDGCKWRFIPCVKGVFVTALACGEDGTIYVGTQYGFGYLLPDIYGKLQYYSISDSLIDNYFNTVVWKVHTVNGHAYFQTEDAIFDYYKGKITTILPDNSFHLSFLVNGQLFIREREKGLLIIEKNQLNLIAGGEAFAQFGVFSIIPLNKTNDSLLIFTQEAGIWKYANKQCKKINTSDEVLFENSIIYGAIRLFDGNIALNTINNGLLIINNKSELLAEINTSNSDIEVNDIKQIVQDKQGNIWCATNKGISVVKYSSPVSIFSKESGLQSNVYAVCRYLNKLYVGTSTGLYKFEPSTGFKKVEGIIGPVWALQVFDNELIITANEQLLTYKGQNYLEIDKINARSVCYLEEKRILLSGGKNGIDVYERVNNHWVKKNHIEQIQTEVLSLVTERNRKNIRIWVGTLLEGVFAIDILENHVYKINHYGVEQKLPEGFSMPFFTGNQVVFGTNEGLYSFDVVHQKEIFKTIPVFGFDIRKPVNFLSKAGEHLYISLTDEILLFKNDMYCGNPLAGVDAGKVRTIYPESKLSCWFGCDEALILFNTGKFIPNINNFKTFIRNVICFNDSDIFYGYRFSGMETPTLDYKENELSFEFASLFYLFPEKTVYSFWLEGNDEQWSNWSTDKKAFYTNLREGKYTFHVKAKNVYGYESKEATFSFSILPPWYRTWPAYFAYLLLLILLVFTAIRISIYRVRQKNIRLERIVKERTAEIAQKNVVLQEQKDVIEKEKAKSEELLLNTLPAKVVEELKEKGYTEPESFENVTVYFSDIKGFTDLSGTLDPKYLISKLNEMFTAFDDIMSKYGCERIKTIGDAYMAVCGLPQTNPNHAEMMALAAIDILNYLTERNKTDDLPITIRIGLNSGKVTGGIVGVRKYIYDVFGDTVNTASRMESNGEAMKINVSEMTYHLLKHKFSFEERPLLEVKGKGVLKMYFLVKKEERI